MTEQRKSADTRPPAFDPQDEKSVLLSFLNYQRTSIAAKAHGAPEPWARTAGVPSGTSLLGLIKHLTAAEGIWFEWSFAGAEVELADLDMKVGGDESAGQILADYAAAVARANTVIEAAPDLSAPAARGMGPDREQHTLRWILAHMIGETARHAGHADILREELDGSTGR
ncbi:DinB family protein [Actinospica durhamensis]|uniref:DinB family protein n=1 Tax=Actinospica durhamensis TaxID=1508375 RepID=A0A941INF9_9ACTN|nr:DinB family protein [Actinospica durhamensis]MBR7835365.1 DinB family protein [Actinospica durhamensis]